MRRHHEERRRLLTRGERVFVWAYMLLSAVTLAGIPLVVFGRHGVRTAGIALLIVALLLMAIPISPFLRTRVRRRENQQKQA
jgi:cation transport ATPase